VKREAAIPLVRLSLLCSPVLSRQINRVGIAEIDTEPLTVLFKVAARATLVGAQLQVQQAAHVIEGHGSVSLP